MTHPFPVLVDAVATGVIALTAGGAGATALRLAIGMLLLQAAIGIANDVIDEPLDAGRKAAKPIPAGLVTARFATGLAVAAGVAGLVVSASGGPMVLLLGTLILAIGLLYDLRLKGTPWSWLPFALGIPLLPVYAWAGATGSVPGTFGVLLPAAFCAGAALAVANALADVERDRDAGVSSVALALGPRAAWSVHAALHLVVLALAASTVPSGDGPTADGLTSGRLLAVGIPGAVILAGVALAGTRSARRRERGWETQVVGVAALAAGWLLALRG